MTSHAIRAIFRLTRIYSRLGNPFQRSQGNQAVVRNPFLIEEAQDEEKGYGSGLSACSHYILRCFLCTTRCQPEGFETTSIRSTGTEHHAGMDTAEAASNRKLGYQCPESNYAAPESSGATVIATHLDREQHGNTNWLQQ